MTKRMIIVMTASSVLAVSGSGGFLSAFGVLGLGAAGASARARAAAPILLRGGEAARLELCGRARSATIAKEHEATVAVIQRARGPLPVLRVDRCALGRWTGARGVQSRRLGHSDVAAIDTSRPGDLRIRLRGHRPAYLRVGVGEIVDLSVKFPVLNVNRSLVPCLTDGKRYTLSGHIVGPLAAIHDGAATTLYLHGAAVPEATWRMPVPGYDYGFEEARLGHVSVTLDRVGYGASPTPNGLLNCGGGQADIAHQIIVQLRSGSYQAPGPIRFARVALAGHSAGQLIAEIEAYSFGDIDAFVVGGWGDPVATPADGVALLPTLLTCATGGEPKRPGEPSGYAFTFKGTERQLLFHNADDQVIQAYASRHERDPCDPTLVTAPPINALRLPRVSAPVFLFYGLNDALWPSGTGSRQRALFTGSHDVTLLQLPDTGHMIMLGRTAPTFRARVSDWLRAHGF
jgi:pimeloyl-ACP methyl ester carboxylesterase